MGSPAVLCSQQTNPWCTIAVYCRQPTAYRNTPPVCLTHAATLPPPPSFGRVSFPQDPKQLSEREQQKLTRKFVNVRRLGLGSRAVGGVLVARHGMGAGFGAGRKKGLGSCATPRGIFFLGFVATGFGQGTQEVPDSPATLCREDCFLNNSCAATELAQGMKEILGPFTDVPASDIGTDERHM